MRVSENAAPGRHARDFHLLRDHHLGAHHPGIADPAHQADRDIHIDQAGPQHRDDGDHQDEEGKGDHDVDQPHHAYVDKQTVIAGERAHQAADDEGRKHGEKPDLQIDRCTIDDPQQHVAPQTVGAEGVGQARRRVNRLQIERRGISRPDQRPEDGERDPEQDHPAADDEGARRFAAQETPPRARDGGLRGSGHRITARRRGSRKT